AAHHSQIDEDTFFLMLPDEAFATAFGTEWFVRRGATRTGEPYETDIYADL
ncbi:MAG: GlcNAc-PI de-N-acetylase, partial [Acidimicrobiaceae bacterium]|nr:GlcNAc-PI de-N-acetylase [Acidimicrobiaceae bacterium]